jgi:hypothetical protein
MVAKIVPVTIGIILPCKGECGADVTAAAVSSFGVFIGMLKMYEAVLAHVMSAMDEIRDNWTTAEALCKEEEPNNCETCKECAERRKENKDGKLAEIARVGVSIALQLHGLPKKLLKLCPFIDYA